MKLIQFHPWREQAKGKKRSREELSGGDGLSRDAPAGTRKGDVDDAAVEKVGKVVPS